MDPNECLRIIRAEINNWSGGACIGEFDADRLAEHVEALDEWMAKGGAAPLQWDSVAGYGRKLTLVKDGPPF